jgi:glycoprotein endo-alpha-1,2-mannosidase
VLPVLNAAGAQGLRVGLHVEPYEGRSYMSVRRDVSYIVSNYGAHPALHRDAQSGLPVMYLYDSYRTTARFGMGGFGVGE